MNIKWKNNLKFVNHGISKALPDRGIRILKFCLFWAKTSMCLTSNLLRLIHLKEMLYQKNYIQSFPTDVM